MKKRFLFLTLFLSLIPTVAICAENNDPMQSFTIPAWDSLKIERTEKSVWLKTETGSAPIEFYALKREATPKIEARLEKDCVVMNTGDMEKADFGNVQMQIRGLDASRMANRDYCLYFNVQGPAGCRGNFYFEGHTLDGKHFWRVKEVNFSGQLQKIAFDQFIPDGLLYLNLRYDFFGCGEFRLYTSRVEMEELAPSALSGNVKPELLFYVSFDGETADADFAKGEKKPRRAEKLAFTDDAVKGKALELRDAEKSALEYLSAGNILPEEGAISVWVKPDWNVAEGTHGWRTILSNPWEQETRIGSGALWCWIHEGRLRFDTSDLRDSYMTMNIPHEDNWVHVVFCWDRFSKKVYINNHVRRSLGDSTNMAQPVRPLRYARTDFETFFVGCRGAYQTVEGKLDELRIYSKPLSQEEVEKLYREFRPISLVETGTKCLKNDVPGTVTAVVRNASGKPISGKVRVIRNKLTENGNIDELDSAPEITTIQEATFAPNADTAVTLNVPKQEAGMLSVQVLIEEEEIQDSLPVAVLEMPHSVEFLEGERKRIARESASKNLWTEELELKLMEEVDLSKVGSETLKERFTHFGEYTVRELDGRKYLEMKNEAGSRFAFHLPKLEKGKVYCFEWDIPDDKMRTVDIIAQTALRSGFSEYELQTGYCTGDEYPNTGKWLTQRMLFWSRGENFALVFTSARTVTPIDTESGKPAGGKCVGGGAAVGKVRIYEVLNEELPVARVNPAKPVKKWTRPVGIYFEDPAINYDFGADGSTHVGYAVTLDRLCQYMKFSGQNMLAYPMAWYNGPIGKRYNPRNHVPYFFEGILERFDREGLEFMGTFNQNNVSFDVPLLSRVDVLGDALNDTYFTIHNTGTVHPGGWHGSPPIFNTLHPEIQKMTLRQLDEILAYAAKHPSFKGIILHLPRHALHSLGDIRAGYNDYLIEMFEKETGIQIPVDKKDVKRGKLCYDWLMNNAREEWVDWRCRKIADWYKTLAKRLSDARADLKLGINCMVPILYEDSSYDSGTERDFWGKINREMGVDAKYFADVPNMFIEQTVFPADYRWTENRKPDGIRARLRNTEEYAGMYTSLEPSENAWIHHHDRYWESAIGTDDTKTMTAEWFKEHPWRVSTLNPTGFYAMKHYIMPLKYKDILGITKGGFLIGTYGMERELVAFSAAFRALPAVPFTDCEDLSTEDVKVRTHTDGKYTWYYAVNASAKVQEVTIPMNAKKAVDLARNVLVPVTDGKITVKLEPYSLRSFRVKK